MSEVDLDQTGGPVDDPAPLKRLRMRSWRRGIKEMDLILGPFADETLTVLSAEDLALFDALLGENDHDLYQWVTARIGKQTAQPAGPIAYADLLDRIAAHAAPRFVS
jgi:antitoxin CptB